VDHQELTTLEAQDADRSEPGRSFTDLLLVAVIVLMIASGGMAGALYVLPRENLTIPEIQPAIHVARETAFPIGASRLVHWGDRLVLVVRLADQRYFALQGVSPFDGCVLEWLEQSSRVVSPCSHVVYDARGYVVAGLSTEPLRQYAVFSRSGSVYVAAD
jgi:nitrite reductase/ring-hydroxylating ferredoxin subunit